MSSSRLFPRRCHLRLILFRNFYIVPPVYCVCSLVPTIFRHALRMSNQARQERSIGAIVNHMAADTEKILLLCTSMHNLWSCPMRIALGLFLLIRSLGVAGIFGIISVVLILPIQTWIMGKSALAGKQVLQASDVRIKILNEVLGGMRVIKYYAWERPFQEQVRALRETELGKLWSANIFRAWNSFFMNVNPVAMAVGTFVAFAILRGNIEPSQAFVALTLFNQMLFPLMLFPSTMSTFLDTLVSIDRIQDFLLSPTVNDPLSEEEASTACDENGMPLWTLGSPSDGGIFLRVDSKEPEVKMEDATFSWGTSIAPSVVGATLTVARGELLAIVGQTGSGKSSLLSAMIGEMMIVHGRAKLSGSVAYVPQQGFPIFLNALLSRSLANF